MSFAHLHVHTDKSQLDGHGRAERYVQRAIELGQPALAITDHGTMSGVYEFYTACAKAGIQPIVGIEAYGPRLASVAAQIEAKQDKNYHLTLLAMNQQGYQNLLYLSSQAWLTGFYGKPLVDRDLLAQHHEGILCLSGCMSGEIAAILKPAEKEGEPDPPEAERFARARDAADWYRSIFGDRYYLEVHNQDMAIQPALNERLFRLGAQLGIPMVAANDCFIAGTMVLTSRGVVPIEQIATGDKVITHRNRLRQVLVTNTRHVEQTYRVTTNQGTSAFTATENHPVYTTHKITANRFSVPEWKTVGNLTTGDYLLLHATTAWDGQGVEHLDIPALLGERHARHRTPDGYTTYRSFGYREGCITVPEKLTVDDDLLFVLGYFIANGHIDHRSGQIGFASHLQRSHALDRIERYFASFGAKSSRYTHGNGSTMELSSVVWQDILEVLCGSGAANKHLPVLNGSYRDWSLPQIGQVLGAYFSGDGHLAKKPEGRTVACATTSSMLAHQVCDVLASLGIVSLPTIRTHEGKLHKNPQADPSKWAPLYVLYLSEADIDLFAQSTGITTRPTTPALMRRRKAIRIGDYLALKVRSVETVDRPTTVYNLQVEEDETYVANSYIVHNCHYVLPQDAAAHALLLCLQTNAKLDDPGRMRLETENFYLRSAQEMLAAFPGHEDAVHRTLEVASRCQLTLDWGRAQFPAFPLPAGKTVISHLRAQVEAGLTWRYGDRIHPAHRERVAYELSVIESTGYPLYFLIVADYVRYAREQGILAVPRGSVAGSLCIYALGISDIDPMPEALGGWNIGFERFLHAERKGMPDIDMDFSDDRRQEVIDYLRGKYGRDHVGKIINFNTLGPRAAVRDAARVLGLSYKDSDRLAKTVPEDTDTLAEALQTTALQVEAENPQNARVLQAAQTIEGLTKASGEHAGGVVVTAGPLWQYCPVQRPKKTEGQAQTDHLVAAWDKDMLETVGLIKMDLLGLVNFSMLQHAIRLINDRHGTTYDALQLSQQLPTSYDDPQARKTFDMLGRGETEAVFQLESEGMRGVLTGLKPKRVQDLMAVVALYRPGPMATIPGFIDAANGRAPTTPPHPNLAPYLEETYGKVVYQDDVLNLVRVMAGYSLGEADVLRKAMGKKIKALMDEQRTKFLERCVDQGHPATLAEQLWALVEPFAGYGFPKGHAAAYGVVAYQTAFFKANFPLEYLTAVLSHEKDTDKVALAIAEARKFELVILPPDLQVSQWDFMIESTPSGDAIRYGLGKIQNIGKDSIENLVAARTQHGPFTDLGQVLDHVSLQKVNARVLTNLTKAGVFDGFVGTPAYRHRLLAVLESAIEARRKTIRALAKDARVPKRLKRDTDESYQARLDEALATHATLRQARQAPTQVTLPELPPQDRLTWLDAENEVLGVYLSGHPLRTYAALLTRERAVPIDQVTAQRAGKKLAVGALLATHRVIQDKNGQFMAFVTLTDESGSIEATIFARQFEACKPALKNGAVVLARGKVQVRHEQVGLLLDEVTTLMAPEEDATLPMITPTAPTVLPLAPSLSLPAPSIPIAPPPSNSAPIVRVPVDDLLVAWQHLWVLGRQATPTLVQLGRQQRLLAPNV